MPEYSAGEYGSTVAVVERAGRRNWYLRVWDPQKGRPRYFSTGTPDIAAAKKQARDFARKLEDGVAEARTHGVPIRAVMRRYLAERTPRKGNPTSRSEDKRRAAMWLDFLGPATPAVKITKRQWERFIEERSEDVRPRTVRADCSWLRTVLRWAVQEEIIHSNPTLDYKLPPDRNPRRVMATRERYEAIMQHADPTLSAILPISVWTGRRLSSVLQLQASDIRLDAIPPTIRWRAESDKLGKEWVVPIGPDLARHLRRYLKKRGIVDGWLFPSPKNPEKHMDRHRATKLLRKAEKAAGLAPQEGTRFHAYRRMWATEHKHLPRADVAYYGGWINPRTLDLYEKPDDATLLEIATGHRELREPPKRKKSRPSH